MRAQARQAEGPARRTCSSRAAQREGHRGRSALGRAGGRELEQALAGPAGLAGLVEAPGEGPAGGDVERDLGLAQAGQVRPRLDPQGAFPGVEVQRPLQGHQHRHGLHRGLSAEVDDHGGGEGDRGAVDEDPDRPPGAGCPEHPLPLQLAWLDVAVAVAVHGPSPLARGELPEQQRDEHVDPRLEGGQRDVAVDQRRHPLGVGAGQRSLGQADRQGQERRSGLCQGS